jgi:hypothetical protein
MIIILVKMSYLLILIKTLVQILRLLVMIFCNAHLPEYDSNPQSAAQALISKKSKHWWKAMITDFLNGEEKNYWVIVTKSKVPKGSKIIGNRWEFMPRKMMVLLEAVLLPKGSVRSLVKTFKNIILQLSMILLFVWY